MSGEPHRDLRVVLELNDKFRTTWLDADWDAHRDVLAPDLEFIDHRPASLGSMRGRDAYIEATRVIREMFSEVEIRIVEQHVVASHGSLAHTVLRCTADDGGEIEFELLNLNTYRGTSMSRLEFYPLDQLNDALEHLESLSNQADGLP